MLNADSNKTYIIHINLPGQAEPVQELCPGRYLDETVEVLKYKYPDFKRIAVYEAETKEAVGFIKK